MDDQAIINEYRAKLLSRIPEVQQSSETKALIREHQEEIKRYEEEWEKKNQNRGMQSLRPAVEVEQLFEMSNDEIDKLLKQTAEAAVERDNMSMRLGTLLAQEFEKFAEREQERALVIVGKLNAESHSEITEYILRGLARSDFESNKRIEIVRDLNKRGFNSRSVRDDMAYLLRGAAIDQKGLPDDICELLEEWLKELPQDESDTDDDSNSASDQNEDRRGPILFGLGDMVMLPNNWYWMGESLKLGLCLREEPKTEKWRDILQDLIGRPYPSEVFEAWLFSELRFSQDRSVLAPTIYNLLVAHPKLLELQVGSVAIVQHAPWLNDEQLEELIESQKSSPDSRSQQAAGEVSAFVWLRDERNCCRVFVDETLKSQNPNLEYVKVGIAYAAANGWTVDSTRGEANDLLVRLCQDSSSAVLEVILSHTFCQDGCLVDDESSRKILNAISDAISRNELRETYNLTEAMLGFSQVDAELTLKVCRSLVDSLKGSKESHRINHGLSESHLVQIALTLHQSSKPKIREQALDLFEDLFQLRGHSAIQSLKQIDFRPN